MRACRLASIRTTWPHWCSGRSAQRHIAGNIGYVPGTIEHRWHGPKERRGYISRWGILTKHGFDPMADLKRNTHGLPELAGNKPELRRDIDRYFRLRAEDTNAW